MMNDLANQNEQYFNYLKNLTEQNNPVFSNLTNLKIQKNYLFYTENDSTKMCYLNNIYLGSLDTSLFKFSPNEIIYILNNISLMVNDPGTLDKKIKYMYKLLDLNELLNEHIKYIENYLIDIHYRKKIHEKFMYAGDKNEIDKLDMPIHNCFDTSLETYGNPASERVRFLEEDYYKSQLNNDSSNQKEKEYVRMLKSSHNVVAIESPYENIAGFMSATFIISLVSILGIVVTIVLYAIQS